MKNILFFGDSLTAGYGLSAPSAQSFPALLARQAISEGMPFEYTNAGISGDTTASALLRLPPLLKSNNDIFVIGLGANDMLRGQTPTSMSQNLEQIVTQIKHAQPKPYLSPGRVHQQCHSNQFYYWHEIREKATVATNQWRLGKLPEKIADV